jgi:hypothetical protein
MRAREYPSGLIRAASKQPDVKVARSLPGGGVFGKMTTVHVLILPMRRPISVSPVTTTADRSLTTGP